MRSAPTIAIQPLSWSQPVGRRVLRGNSWINPSGDLRTTRRFRDHPGFRSGLFGFRVVLEVL